MSLYSPTKNILSHTCKTINSQCIVATCQIFISGPCGGFVNISEHQEQELIYEIPFPTYVSTCAWVLWTPNQSQIIQIELVNNTSLDFLPEFSLSVVENPEWDDDCCVTDL